MRKVPFIMFGVVAICVMLLALKVFAILYESMPEIKPNQYKKTDLAQLLDDLLLEENGSGSKLYWTDSMEKLVKLGPPVVPDLIEAIETARDRAESIKYEGRSEWRINHDKEMLQTRAAMVLGKIGDPCAIAVLTSLQCLEGGMICSYVDEALKSIDAQEQHRLNPEYTDACTNFDLPRPKVKRNAGFLNAKAINFPEPKLTAYDKRWAKPENVRVDIVVGAGTGKVVWAQVQNGSYLLGDAVKKVVCQVRFAPINHSGARIYVSGYLIYKFQW